MSANNASPPSYTPRQRQTPAHPALNAGQHAPAWIGHMDRATAIIRAFEGGLRDGQDLSPGLRKPILGGELVELQYLRGMSVGVGDWKRQHPVPYELFRSLETDEVNGEGSSRLNQRIAAAVAQPRPPPLHSLRDMFPQVWAPPAILPIPRYRAPRIPLHAAQTGALTGGHTITMPHLPLPVGVDIYTAAAFWSSQLDELALLEDFGCWIVPESVGITPISSTRVAPAVRRAIAKVLREGPLPELHLPRSAAANMFGTVFASGAKDQILKLVRARAIIAPDVCLFVIPNRVRDPDHVGTFECAVYSRKDCERVRESLKDALGGSAAAVQHCVDLGLVPDLLFASIGLEYVKSGGRKLWNVSLPVPRKPGMKMEGWRQIIATLLPADGTGGAMTLVRLRCKICGCSCHDADVCPTRAYDEWTGIRYTPSPGIGLNGQAESYAQPLRWQMPGGEACSSLSISEREQGGSRYGGTDSDGATSTWRQPGSTVSRVGREPPVAPTHKDGDGVAGGGGPSSVDARRHVSTELSGTPPSPSAPEHPVPHTWMGHVYDDRDIVPSPSLGQPVQPDAGVLRAPTQNPVTLTRAAETGHSKRKRAELSDDESQYNLPGKPEVKRARMGGDDPMSDNIAQAGELTTGQNAPEGMSAIGGRKRPRDSSPGLQDDAHGGEQRYAKRVRSEDSPELPAGTPQQSLNDSEPQRVDQGPNDAHDHISAPEAQPDEQPVLRAESEGDDGRDDGLPVPSIDLSDLDPFEALSECDEELPDCDTDEPRREAPRRGSPRIFAPRPAIMIAGQRRQSREKKMRERAHIRIGTLNMNGRGASRVSFSGSKWPEVNAIIRDHRLAVLVLQETHLDDSHLADIQRLYPRLHVRNSSHAAATSNAGIAIVLNKDHIADTETCRSWEIIPGRAIVLRLEWKDQILFILGVYGYNDEAQAEAMWEKIDEWLLSHAHEVPRVDVMLGDMNFVEDDTDRIPVRYAGVDACRQRFQALTTRLRIRDGWRAWNAGKVEWTWRRPGTFERSRLDRIYVSRSWLNDSRDWRTEMAMSSTDHYLVSVDLTNKLCPEVGRGRRAIPNSIIEDSTFQEEIHPSVMDLARDVEHARLHRSIDNNPQTVLDTFKKSIGQAAVNRAKAVGSQAKRAVRQLNKERLAAQNDASLNEEEKRSRVQTLELRIAEQQIKMMRQKSEQRSTWTAMDRSAMTQSKTP
ncbi:hypothetical protein AURDEDRAFT_120944 [Auricularia subglabra TFB-10046 SS5]|nr:hypothetical protein AURDEDRAFT_120944 [Auricularia subglabra TFB-10046 SS5]